VPSGQPPHRLATVASGLTATCWPWLRRRTPPCSPTSSCAARSRPTRWIR
jgi:hypothetical protein